MDENSGEVYGYYDRVVGKTVFDERMNLIERQKHNPKKLVSEANIVYLSPADASNTSLADLRQEPAVRVHRR